MESSTPVDLAPGATLIAALAAQDFERLQATFATDVRFRALTPHSTLGMTGDRSTAETFQRWFGPAQPFQLVDHAVTSIASRVHLQYRFQGVEDGAPFVCEQQAYGTVVDGRFTDFSVVCSGFLPPAL